MMAVQYMMGAHHHNVCSSYDAHPSLLVSKTESTSKTESKIIFCMMQNMIFDSVFEVDSVLETKSDF